MLRAGLTKMLKRSYKPEPKSLLKENLLEMFCKMATKKSKNAKKQAIT